MHAPESFGSHTSPLHTAGIPATLKCVDRFESWPESVRTELTGRYGSPVAVERLGGMSPATVWRGRFADGSVIVKSSPSPRERLLYEHGGAQLRRAGVPLPERLWSDGIDGVHWLVLEDIPTPVPIPDRDSWRPDRRMVTILARLHTLALHLPPELDAIEAWRWTDAMTEAALSFFPSGVARAIGAPMRALQQEARHLDTPWCWISGDPNPSNWGERADGTPVLYDWEIVRRGVPAVDLAILVVGLGDAAKYEAVAACYLEERPRLTDLPIWREETLPRDIALAKAWTVASLLRAGVTGRGNLPDNLRAQLTESVPPWITSIARTGEVRS